MSCSHLLKVKCRAPSSPHPEGWDGHHPGHLSEAISPHAHLGTKAGATRYIRLEGFSELPVIIGFQKVSLPSPQSLSKRETLTALPLCQHPPRCCSDGQQRPEPFGVGPNLEPAVECKPAGGVDTGPLAQRRGTGVLPSRPAPRTGEGQQPHTLSH